MDNIRARIVYRNREQQPVSEWNCSLKEYADAMRLEVLKLITDIEDFAYLVNGSKPKDEWADDEIALFNKIKHKILDKAGEIGRLSENLYIPTPEETSSISFWKSLFGQKDGD